ncbi:MAG TPA: YARHG domain-containing protein [Candidatus Aphodovivens avistercoris]|nr:YARHG domain-containing protein [Candidatus Aphodovivens avistercoris]
MYCGQCGAQVPDGAAFCGSCGAPVEGAPAPAASEAVAAGSGSSENGGGFAGVRPDAALVGGGAGPAGSAAGAAGGGPVDGAGAPARKGLSRGAIIGIAVGAAAVVVAIVLIVVLAVLPNMGGGANEGAGGQPATGESAADAATPVEVSISQIDNSAFPQMTLYVQLTDQSGAELGSAAPEQFEVVEVGSDGTEYQATVDELAPVQEGDSMNLNLVLDQSGSMGNSGMMGNAKAAAHAFIDQLSQGGANFAEITSFDDYVYNVQPFTDNAALLDSAVDALRPNGETALYDALYWALQRTNLKSGSRVVIAFTDGAENASSYTLSDVEELSKLTGIPVYLVGIGDSIDVAELEELAAACNGRYYDASTDDLAQALEEIYAAIYADQRSLFRLTYTSAFDGDTDRFRTVRLEAADGSGYAGSAESSYMPVDNVPAYDNAGNLNEYVLPDSGSRYYSRSELEDLSLWELYLARNEIFARYGRGFKNQDLVDYFSTRRWYTQRYTPEEFDAMSTPLNDYEQKNTELMLEIEKERNSPYLVTAK